MLKPRIHARSDSSGRQTIDIVVHRGYRPDSISALAGVPLRVVFWRDDDDACTERVVFSTPRLDRRLAAHGATIVDLPALPPGEIRFTCGMGRYRGRLELVDRRRAPVLTRLRRRTNLLETPLGTAFVLWICSLPLIALLAVLALDPGSAIAAAGAALGAWVVGCLWAFRRAARPLVAGIALPSGTAANAAAHGGGGGDASSGQAPQRIDRSVDFVGRAEPAEVPR